MIPEQPSRRTLLAALLTALFGWLLPVKPQAAAQPKLPQRTLRSPIPLTDLSCRRAVYTYDAHGDLIAVQHLPTEPEPVSPTVVTYDAIGPITWYSYDV